MFYVGLLGFVMGGLTTVPLLRLKRRNQARGSRPRPAMFAAANGVVPSSPLRHWPSFQAPFQEQESPPVPAFR